MNQSLIYTDWIVENVRLETASSPKRWCLFTNRYDVIFQTKFRSRMHELLTVSVRIYRARARTQTHPEAKLALKILVLLGREENSFDAICRAAKTHSVRINEVILLLTTKAA